MKTVKKQSLTASQKKYLKLQILQYVLLSAIINEPLKSPKPPKVKPPPKHSEKLPIEVELAPVLREEVDKEDIAKQETKRSFHLPKLHIPTRRLLKASLAVIAVLAVVVLVQLLYPSDRSLPLSRLEAHGYLGFANKNVILSSFDDFNDRVVTVHTHDKSITTSYKDLGVSVEPLKTVEDMTSYSFTERLIPFSILVKGNKNYSVVRSLDESQIHLFVDNVIAQAGKKPVNAEVKLQGTQFLVTSSEEGYEYQESVLKSKVLRSDLSDRAQLVFTPTILKPDISTDDAYAVVNRMQLRIDNPLLINAEGKSMRIESATMASWVDLAPKPENRTVEIVFNRGRVAETLRALAQDVDYPQMPTVVTYLNGVQAGRLEGSVGKVLQFDNLVDRVVANTSPLTSTLEAQVVTVPPEEQIDRKYSKDSQGIQTLIEYWTANNKGDYSIDFRSLNGKIIANKNPHRLLPSVGIYRTYIASLIYDKAAAGSISMTSPTITGQSVDVCLQRMMQESDDGCTNALGSLVGWGASDALLQAQGFDNTTLTEGAGLTTANDLTDWILKLNGGNITTVRQASTLLDIMSRQTNKSGIPSGSSGLKVASKSGSYGRITNDVGLVYHPGGIYALSVLSEGSSPSLIADLTREINKVMSQ